MNFDNKKIDASIIYISMLADGIDPNTNRHIDQNTFNSPNVIRCMYFVKEVLMEVKKGSKIKVSKLPYPISVLDNYKYTRDLTITGFLSEINNLVDINKYEKINVRKITDYLKNNGYLTRKKIEDTDKEVTVVTELGKGIGMYNEYRRAFNGERYLAVMYNESAQEFIIDNLELIIKKDYN